MTTSVVADGEDPSELFATTENETSKEMFNLDLCVFDFLTQFRKIQNDSVAEYSTYLNKLALLKPDDTFQMLWFDQHFD